jgi:hypothetical protein
MGDDIDIIGWASYEGYLWAKEKIEKKLVRLDELEKSIEYHEDSNQIGTISE